MHCRTLVLAFVLPLAACSNIPPATTRAVPSFDPNDPAGVGVTRFSRYTSASPSMPTDDRNCEDFQSALDAQRFFTGAGGPQNDPHDLDRDGDGYACEWGTEVRRRADAEAAAARRRIEAASRCYTGPRGGTYTIGPGGDRDYNGC